MDSPIRAAGVGRSVPRGKRTSHRESPCGVKRSGEWGIREWVLHFATCSLFANILSGFGGPNCRKAMPWPQNGRRTREGRTASGWREPWRADPLRGNERPKRAAAFQPSVGRNVLHSRPRSMPCLSEDRLSRHGLADNPAPRSGGIQPTSRHAQLS
jgi:hypothetical protein